MNLVFLDIDGVLNNLGTVAAYGNPSKHLDPVSVRLVEKLCEEGGAQIVVSSSWRNGDTDRLRRELYEVASPKLSALIISETPERPDVRGTEIQEWLDEHSTENQRYVILDDDSDMLPGQNFVKTTFQDGFRFGHYIEALRFLNPEHPDCTRLIIPVTDQTGQKT